VQTVRTKDNALITVKLMLFFLLVDVERMLDNSADPPGDLFNAVSADVIEWCAARKFDEFLAGTEALNQLGMSARELHRAALQIGCVGTSVPDGIATPRPRTRPPGERSALPFPIRTAPQKSADVTRVAGGPAGGTPSSAPRRSRSA
jgi:hypothetical protein